MSTEQQAQGGSWVYRRELPGGGYVAIDVQRISEESMDVARTRVCVERRGKEERRSGHRPIVIAEADGDERSAAFTEMYQVAADNAAIARALLRLGEVQPGRAD